MNKVIFSCRDIGLRARIVSEPHRLEMLEKFSRKLIDEVGEAYAAKDITSYCINEANTLNSQNVKGHTTSISGVICLDGGLSVKYTFYCKPIIDDEVDSGDGRYDFRMDIDFNEETYEFHLFT